MAKHPVMTATAQAVSVKAALSPPAHQRVQWMVRVCMIYKRVSVFEFFYFHAKRQASAGD